jgi:hypothetical protein
VLDTCSFHISRDLFSFRISKLYLYITHSARLFEMLSTICKIIIIHWEWNHIGNTKSEPFYIFPRTAIKFKFRRVFQEVAAAVVGFPPLSLCNNWGTFFYLSFISVCVCLANELNSASYLYQKILFCFSCTCCVAFLFCSAVAAIAHNNRIDLSDDR